MGPIHFFFGPIHKHTQTHIVKMMLPEMIEFTLPFYLFESNYVVQPQSLPLLTNCLCDK